MLNIKDMMENIEFICVEESKITLCSNNAGGKPLIKRWYNQKDEHLERSSSGTARDGFPCIGN